MPIDPIKIPQNVNIEDRIIGPVTLKQIIISAIGCGFSYALYSSVGNAMGGVPPLPLTILLWVPGAISLLFAFVRINDLSLLHIVLLLLETANKPSVRVWTPRRGIAITIRTTSAAAPNKEVESAPKSAADHIDALSSILDEPSAQAVAKHGSTEKQTESPWDEDEASASGAMHGPVDPSRITASPLNGKIMRDIRATAPMTPEPNDDEAPLMRDLSTRRP